jgi:hypothetical protein
LSFNRLFSAAIFAATLEEFLRLFRIKSAFFQTFSDGHIQFDLREVAFAIVFCFHSFIFLVKFYNHSTFITTCCYSVVHRYFSIDWAKKYCLLFSEEFFQRAAAISGFFATDTVKRVCSVRSHFHGSGFFEQRQVVGDGGLRQT